MLQHLYEGHFFLLMFAASGSPSIKIHAGSADLYSQQRPDGPNGSKKISLSSSIEEEVASSISLTLTKVT
jgi:hypothetical protein